MISANKYTEYAFPWALEVSSLVEACRQPGRPIRGAIVVAGWP